LNRLPQLAEPLLQFDLVNEHRQLRGEESWQRETGRSSKTLAKYPDFRKTYETASIDATSKTTTMK
jgi:hypothetical protein